METIILIVYTAWAIYSGYKVVSGRNEWLDRKQPVNIVVKAVVSIVVGYIIAAFYLIYLILKFLGAVSK